MCWVAGRGLASLFRGQGGTDECRAAGEASIVYELVKDFQVAGGHAQLDLDTGLGSRPRCARKEALSFAGWCWWREPCLVCFEGVEGNVRECAARCDVFTQPALLLGCHIDNDCARAPHFGPNRRRWCRLRAGVLAAPAGSG